MYYVFILCIIIYVYLHILIIDGCIFDSIPLKHNWNSTVVRHKYSAVAHSLFLSK